MARRKKYSGVLVKPLKPAVSEERRRSIVPISDTEVAEGIYLNLPGILDRMIELAKHYGIDPNSKNAGWRLAYALAREHVRGFQTEGVDAKPANAPRKWMDIDRATLWLSVRALRDAGMTKGEALSAIFNNSATCSRLPSVSSVASLERQLRESVPARCEMTALLKKLLDSSDEPALVLALAYIPSLSEVIKGDNK